jgi:putative nucleotidyltransferase with HDIG domain
MQFERLFESSAVLPSPPRVVQELIASFDDDELDFRAVAAKLGSDPALSAKLLRLANSAYYHCSRPIGTVDDALTLLGFATVRTLVVSSALIGGWRGGEGLDLPQFWRHSGLVAAGSRALAKPARCNGEVAFTVGLMHAIGVLVMHQRMGERMQQLARIAAPWDPMRLELERRDLGYTHAEVGAELARRWRFPPEFAQALAGYPDPLGRGAQTPFAAITHLALWRVSAEREQWVEPELSANFPHAVAASLGLDAAEALDLPLPSELAAGLQELFSA